MTPANLADFPESTPEKRLFMAYPQYFPVDYDINPHMRDENRKLNVVEIKKAREQWSLLIQALESISLQIHVVPL